MVYDDALVDIDTLLSWFVMARPIALLMISVSSMIAKV